MKKYLIGYIIGAFTVGSIVFAATTYYYTSSEVSYTPSDTSWKVSDVKSALDDLKTTSGNALTNLKNTNIAKAVSANGSTLTSVISTLSGIANKGNLTQTINPGGSVSISAGYYSGGKITANANQNNGTYKATSRSTSIDMGANNTYRYVNTNSVPNTNSATYTPSSHGTALDMGANNTYRYVNTTNVYNQGYNAGVSDSKTSSTVSVISSSPNAITVYSNYGTSANVGDFTTCPPNLPTTTYGGTCYVYTGQASVSKSGNIITVTVPQTVRAANRFCGGSDHTDYSRNITVQLRIN